MKPLRNAGIAIIILFIIGLASVIYLSIELYSLSGIYGSLAEAMTMLTETTIFSTISIILSALLIIVIFFGFISLGKRFKNKLLAITSWVLMALLVINQILSIVRDAISSSVLYPFISLGILISIVIVMVLFGIALLKLKDKVKLSKSTGILYIVAGPTLIITVGYFVYIAALVLSAIMFFKASKKFETETTSKKFGSRGKKH